MRRLLLFGALVALVSANAIDAAEFEPLDERHESEETEQKPDFSFFSMEAAQQNWFQIKEELDSKLGFKRKLSATKEAYNILHKCFKGAVLMEDYVKYRPLPVKEESGPLNSEVQEGELQTSAGPVELVPPEDPLAWGVFDFRFQPGGENLSYIEDVAWAVKSAVDVYDNSPLCKDAIKEREGFFMRTTRRLVGKSLKQIVDLFLTVSLHKALYDWATYYNMVKVFGGEEIPTLVATAREALQKKKKLRKLDSRLKSQKARDHKVKQLKAIVANHYLSNLGRAWELIRWQIWKTRKAPDFSPPSEQRTSVIEDRPDGDVDEGTSGSGRNQVDEGASGSERKGQPEESKKMDAQDAENRKQVQSFLVSAKLFMIMVKSKFPYIARMISDTAEAIGNEVMGNRLDGHRILETLPCPKNEKGEMIDPQGKTLFKWRINPTVWVYKFHGLQGIERRLYPGVAEEQSEQVGLMYRDPPQIDDTAAGDLVDLLWGRGPREMKTLFRWTEEREIEREDVANFVKPMFPTKCFRTKQDAIDFLSSAERPITKDGIRHYFTEVKYREMKNYEKVIRKVVREDKEKIKKDVVWQTRKRTAVAQFFKGALGGVATLAALGVAMIGLACLIGVGVAATPLAALPTCALAAAMFGSVTLAVTPTLTLAAVALGGFFFAYSTISSIKSALSFVITPMVMGHRERMFQYRQQMAQQQQALQVRDPEQARRDEEYQQHLLAQQRRDRALQEQELWQREQEFRQREEEERRRREADAQSQGGQQNGLQDEREGENGPTGSEENAEPQQPGEDTP